jgi:Methyltransferase domain
VLRATDQASAGWNGIAGRLRYLQLSESLTLAAPWDPSRTRYELGEYDADFGDDQWKAGQMAATIAAIPDRGEVVSYADIGCGNGGVLVHLRDELCNLGFKLDTVVGYDIARIPDKTSAANPQISFRQTDFVSEQQSYDLITLNDVIEHITQPQRLLQAVAERARYVALHIPLDDRLSVALANQFNYRLGSIGHISFWNASSAINLLTSAGLLPLCCRFTPGFLAPSGRQRMMQRLMIPLRYLMWKCSPPLAARTVGGVSLAVLCRGRKP